MPTEDKITALIDELLEGKSPAEQVTILRHCLEFHAFGHPWADADLVDSMVGNIAREYDLEWTEGEEEEDDD
jgi:hypothetical protein